MVCGRDIHEEDCILKCCPFVEVRPLFLFPFSNPGFSTDPGYRNPDSHPLGRNTHSISVFRKYTEISLYSGGDTEIAGETPPLFFVGYGHHAMSDPSHHTMYMLARCYELQRLHCDGDEADLASLDPGSAEYDAMEERIASRCRMLSCMEEVIRTLYSGYMHLDFGAGEVRILR